MRKTSFAEVVWDRVVACRLLTRTFAAGGVALSTQLTRLSATISHESTWPWADGERAPRSQKASGGENKFMVLSHGYGLRYVPFLFVWN